jgi:pimeloyl-ACP methyl ester carboxylesterase
MARTVVVYVHGLWLNGWESVLLRYRLSRRLDCDTLAFHYRSVGADVAENARALATFLQAVPADTLHLVGHSLGGLLILELFAAAPVLPPGRAVFLGTPARGSRAARTLVRSAVGRRILHHAAHDLLVPEREPRWTACRDLGVIAGTLPIGIGRLVGAFDEPNDGTVLMSETHIVGAKEHLVLRTTHTGMVYSPLVAYQVAEFLREGRFKRR